MKPYIEKQRNRIKDLYIKGIIEINNFKEDYKLIKDKLANLDKNIRFRAKFLKKKFSITVDIVKINTKL